MDTIVNIIIWVVVFGLSSASIYNAVEDVLLQPSLEFKVVALTGLSISLLCVMYVLTISLLIIVS